MAHKQMRAELSCPICMELFRQPRRFPCGHAYCHTCIVTLQQTRGTMDFARRNAALLHCPECRDQVRVDFLLGVEAFPIDFKLSRLVELIRTVENDNSSSSEGNSGNFFNSNADTSRGPALDPSSAGIGPPTTTTTTTTTASSSSPSRDAGNPRPSFSSPPPVSTTSALPYHFTPVTTAASASSQQAASSFRSGSPIADLALEHPEDWFAADTGTGLMPSQLDFDFDDYNPGSLGSTPPYDLSRNSYDDYLDTLTFEGLLGEVDTAFEALLAAFRTPASEFSSGRNDLSRRGSGASHSSLDMNNNDNNISISSSSPLSDWSRPVSTLSSSSSSKSANLGATSKDRKRRKKRSSAHSARTSQDAQQGSDNQTGLTANTEDLENPAGQHSASASGKSKGENTTSSMWDDQDHGAFNADIESDNERNQSRVRPATTASIRSNPIHQVAASMLKRNATTIKKRRKRFRRINNISPIDTSEIGILKTKYSKLKNRVVDFLRESSSSDSCAELANLTDDLESEEEHHRALERERKKIRILERARRRKKQKESMKRWEVTKILMNIVFSDVPSITSSDCGTDDESQMRPTERTVNVNSEEAMERDSSTGAQNLEGNPEEKNESPDLQNGLGVNEGDGNDNNTDNACPVLRADNASIFDNVRDESNPKEQTINQGSPPVPASMASNTTKENSDPPITRQREESSSCGGLSEDLETSTDATATTASTHDARPGEEGGESVPTHAQPRGVHRVNGYPCPIPPPFHRTFPIPVIPPLLLSGYDNVVLNTSINSNAAQPQLVHEVAGVVNMESGGDICSSATTRDVCSGTRHMHFGTGDIRSGTRDIHPGTRDVHSGTGDIRSGTGDIRYGMMGSNENLTAEGAAALYDNIQPPRASSCPHGPTLRRMGTRPKEIPNRRQKTDQSALTVREERMRRNSLPGEGDVGSTFYDNLSPQDVRDARQSQLNIAASDFGLEFHQVNGLPMEPTNQSQAEIEDLKTGFELEERYRATQGPHNLYSAQEVNDRRRNRIEEQVMRSRISAENIAACNVVGSQINDQGSHMTRSGHGESTESKQIVSRNARDVLQNQNVESSQRESSKPFNTVKDTKCTRDPGPHRKSSLYDNITDSTVLKRSLQESQAREQDTSVDHPREHQRHRNAHSHHCDKDGIVTGHRVDCAKDSRQFVKSLLQDEGQTSHDAVNGGGAVAGNVTTQLQSTRRQEPYSPPQLNGGASVSRHQVSVNQQTCTVMRSSKSNGEVDCEVIVSRKNNDDNNNVKVCGDKSQASCSSKDGRRKSNNAKHHGIDSDEEEEQADNAQSAMLKAAPKKPRSRFRKFISSLMWVSSSSSEHEYADYYDIDVSDD